MDELTPEQQAAYDALSSAEKKVVDRMDFEGKQAFLDTKIAAQASTSTTSPPNTISATQATTSGANVAGFTGGESEEDTTYYQEALGVYGGRQVVKATGQPVAGTYTGFKSASKKETTPTGATSALPSMRNAQPRYFEGDEDLINNFSREDIATLQQQMKTAGILGKYKLGIVDNATLASFKIVLGQSNRTGGPWQDGLKQLSVGGSGGTGLTLRVSSPDDLIKIIDQTASYVLGRKIDLATSQRIAKAYQQLQIEEQRGNKMGGVQTQAPQADVFAKKQIEEKSGAEADAYKFAQYAQIVLGGQNG
jgi:hypothetical protein